MRHWLFILMIALLPLRGWLGDAMATDMAAVRVQHSQQTATKIVANDPYAESAKANFGHEIGTLQTGLAAADCAGHAAGDDTHPADSHCESCSACQACHGAALAPAAVSVAAVFNLGTLPRAAAAQFASAQTALGQKPPIS